ncbi:hypothetical protein D3C87_1759340 [compost metagenome]
MSITETFRPMNIRGTFTESSVTFWWKSAMKMMSLPSRYQAATVAFGLVSARQKVWKATIS